MISKSSNFYYRTRELSLFRYQEKRKKVELTMTSYFWRSRSANWWKGGWDSTVLQYFSKEFNFSGRVLARIGRWQCCRVFALFSCSIFRVLRDVARDELVLLPHLNCHFWNCVNFKFQIDYFELANNIKKWLPGRFRKRFVKAILIELLAPACQMSGAFWRIFLDATVNFQR